MYLPRRIFVTVLLVVLLFCACVCEAQSSYDLDDAGIEMQSSYGGKNGRRLQQQSSGGSITTTDNQTGATTTTAPEETNDTTASGTILVVVIILGIILCASFCTAIYSKPAIYTQFGLTIDQWQALTKDVQDAADNYYETNKGDDWTQKGETYKNEKFTIALALRKINHKYNFLSDEDKKELIKEYINNTYSNKDEYFEKKIETMFNQAKFTWQ